MDGVLIFDDEPPDAPRPVAEAAPDFGPHGLALETPTHGGLAPDGVLRLRGLVEGGADPVVAVRVRLNGEDLGRFPAETVRRDVDLTGFDAALDVSRFGCRLDLRLTGLRQSGATAQVKLLTVWRPAFRPERIRIAPLTVAFRADRGDPSKVFGRVSGPDLPVAVDAWRAGGVTCFEVGRDGAFGGALKGGGAEAVHLWARFEGGRPDAYVGLALVSKTQATSLVATVETGDGAPSVRFASGGWTGAGDWSDGRARAFVNGRPVALSPIGADAPNAYRIAPAGWAAALPDQIAFEGEAADGRWTAADAWNLSGLPLRTFMAASAAAKALRVTRGGKTSIVRALRVNPVGDDLVFITQAGTGDGFEAVPFAGLERVAIAHEIDFMSDPAASPRAEMATFLKSVSAPGYRMATVEALNGAVVLPVRALADPPASIDRVILVCRGHNATDEIYVRRPLEIVLKSIGVTLEVVDLSAGGAAAEARLDRPLKPGAVVIVSRTANDAWIERLARDRRGIFIIYLMDDDPPAAADTPGLPQRYRQRMIETAASDFQAMLRLCDRFIVAAPAMAAAYASDKTVLMEPPLIREPAGLAHFDDLSRIRIAYHGTDVHKDDIGFLYEALGAGLRDHNAHLQVISAVKPPASLRGLENVERLPPMAWPDYVEFAQENPAHINLAPLLDTPFNRGKSIIKLLDSASLGAAGLYSRVPPYEGVITDGQDGFLIENDPALWERTLGTLLAEPTRLRAVAEAGLATARRVGDLGRASALWRDLLGL